MLLIRPPGVLNFLKERHTPTRVMDALLVLLLLITPSAIGIRVSPVAESADAAGAGGSGVAQTQRFHGGYGGGDAAAITGLTEYAQAYYRTQAAADDAANNVNAAAATYENYVAKARAAAAQVQRAGAGGGAVTLAGFVPTTMTAAGQHYAARTNERLVDGGGRGGVGADAAAEKTDFEISAEQYVGSDGAYASVYDAAGMANPMAADLAAYHSRLPASGDRGAGGADATFYDVGYKTYMQPAYEIAHLANYRAHQQQQQQQRQQQQQAHYSDGNNDELTRQRENDENYANGREKLHYYEEQPRFDQRQVTAPLHFPMQQNHAVDPEHIADNVHAQSQYYYARSNAVDGGQGSSAQQYEEHAAQQYEEHAAQPHRPQHHPPAPQNGPQVEEEQHQQYIQQHLLPHSQQHYTTQPPPPPLPPITQTVHHTSESAAALAGIPLGKHTHVSKHIPLQFYQQQHVPYNQTVPIVVPRPVITAIPRPYAIHVPVHKTVAVPQLKEVRIPIEKVKPFPIERPVPFIVERRVPYHVEKQVAKPFYYPYPIKVPVLKTIVHRRPAHPHPHLHAHTQHHHDYHHFHPAAPQYVYHHPHHNSLGHLSPGYAHTAALYGANHLG